MVSEYLLQGHLPGSLQLKYFSSTLQQLTIIPIQYLKYVFQDSTTIFSSQTILFLLFVIPFILLFNPRQLLKQIEGANAGPSAQINLPGTRASQLILLCEAENPTRA